MKKVITIIVLTLAVFSGLVYAQNRSGSSVGGNQSTSGTPDQDRLREQDRVQDPTTHDGDEPDQDRDRLQDQDRIRLDQNTVTPANTPAELRNMIQNQGQEFKQNAGENFPPNPAVRNQNQIRTAVRAFLSAENLVGGIGSQVSTIAQEMNNSVQVIESAENEIQNRGFWFRFFRGGDEGNARKIESEMELNQVRIEQLSQLMNQEGLSEEVFQILQEQLQLMNQEQLRLQEIIDDEYGRFGLFDWSF